MQVPFTIVIIADGYYSRKRMAACLFACINLLVLDAADLLQAVKLVCGDDFTHRAG